MIVMTGADNPDQMHKPSPALRRLLEKEEKTVRDSKCPICKQGEEKFKSRLHKLSSEVKEIKKCPLCSLDLKKEKIYYSDQDLIVLQTKDLKGHVERIMIVSIEHTHDIQFENPALFEHALDVLTQIGKRVFKYTPKFVIMDSTFATMNEHWHLVATDLAPQSEDFDQILRTKWIKVIDPEWD